MYEWEEWLSLLCNTRVSTVFPEYLDSFVALDFFRESLGIVLWAWKEPFTFRKGGPVTLPTFTCSEGSKQSAGLHPQLS